MDFSQDLNSTQPNSQLENSKKRPLPQEAEVQEEGGNDTTEAMSQKKQKLNEEETADGPTGEQQEEQLQFEEESSCEINPAVLEMQKRIEMLSSKMKDLQQHYASEMDKALNNFFDNFTKLMTKRRQAANESMEQIQEVYESNISMNQQIRNAKLQANLLMKSMHSIPSFETEVTTEQNAQQ